MHAFHFVTAAVLALAGAAAAAQTVSAEEWMGPALSVYPQALGREAVVAEMQRSRARPQAAAEAWVGEAAGASVAVGAVRRPEVQADLRMAQRAGLLEAQAGEGFDPYGADGARRLAHYRQLREGVAFTRELRRIEGTPDALAAAPAGQAEAE